MLWEAVAIIQARHGDGIRDSGHRSSWRWSDLESLQRQREQNVCLDQTVWGRERGESRKRLRHLV